MAGIVEIENLTKDYGTGEIIVHALRGITLTIKAGEFAAMAGPSGSGKSTLLNIIGGLDTPTGGSVTIEGTDVARLSDAQRSRLRRDQIGFVFQSYNLIPVLTALENAEYILMLQGAPIKERHERVRALLKDVGLEGMEDRFPNQLSGGQQQRVAIARAIASEPALVLADEPTANVDSKTGAALLELMHELHENKGVTFLFSTHDQMVMERAERLLLLRDGQIEADGPPSEILHKGFLMRALLLSMLALLCLVFPAPARALVGDSDEAFGLDGSIRNISGAIDNFNPSPFWLPTNGGDAFSQTILRLTAMGAPTHWLSYELHAVQTLDYSSGGASSGAFSLVPGVTRFRALDATWTPDASGKLTATTLLDRFAVKFSPEWGDITIGRQAITFGKAFFWNPLDVFLAFDPLQFDREYKPGVDALRVDIPLGDFSGITLVGALGREITPTGSYLTGNKAFDADWYGSAVLARFFTLYENYDLSLQAGKIYGGYQVGGGASGEVMEWLELRIEAACFRAMDSLGVYASPLHLPASYLGPLVEDHATAVLGIGHRFENTLHVQMEYLFNGQGEPDRLSLGLVRVSHGQSYHMGRHVLGVTASYEILPIVTGQLAAIASLDARSAQIQPSVTWSASDNVEVVGGAIVSLGERPVGTSPLVPGLQSEFGTFPDFYFLEVKAYF